VSTGSKFGKEYGEKRPVWEGVKNHEKEARILSFDFAPFDFAQGG
jgi:hypothetical protein